jgi:hypothetical protein
LKEKRHGLDSRDFSVFGGIGNIKKKERIVGKENSHDPFFLIDRNSSINFDRKGYLIEELGFVMIKNADFIERSSISKVNVAAIKVELRAFDAPVVVVNGRRRLLMVWDC